jgi:hypothetical protein
LTPPMLAPKGTAVSERGGQRHDVALLAIDRVDVRLHAATFASAEANPTGSACPSLWGQL